MANGRFLLLKELESGRPQLGDGFEPLEKYESPRKQSAIRFRTSETQGTYQHADVFDVSTTVTTDSSLVLSGRGSYLTYVSGKFSSSDQANFFRESTVFSVFLWAEVRRLTADRVALVPGLENIGEEAFQRGYGTQFIKAVALGGYINLLIRFDRVDETTKQNIALSLSFWQNVGNVSLTSALSEHGVRRAFRLISDQTGGTVPLFLGSNLDSLRDHLASWLPTVIQQPVPVAIETLDYNDGVPQFPYDLSSGFGDGGVFGFMDNRPDFDDLASEGNTVELLASIEENGDYYIVTPHDDDATPLQVAKEYVDYEETAYSRQRSSDAAPLCCVRIHRDAPVMVLKTTNLSNLLRSDSPTSLGTSSRAFSLLANQFSFAPPQHVPASDSRRTRRSSERRQGLDFAFRRSSERHQVYAAPAPLWGPWTTVASHIGTATYTIEVEPIGDTVVRGEVRYFNEADNRQVVEPFFEEVSIRTGDSIANVEVRLQGIPTGSSCWVTVS